MVILAQISLSFFLSVSIFLSLSLTCTDASFSCIWFKFVQTNNLKYILPNKLLFFLNKKNKISISWLFHYAVDMKLKKKFIQHYSIQTLIRLVFSFVAIAFFKSILKEWYVFLSRHGCQFFSEMMISGRNITIIWSFSFNI